MTNQPPSQSPPVPSSPSPSPSPSPAPSISPSLRPPVPPSLSQDAQRLLDYLRRWAPRPELARPDHVISKALGLAERSVIDYADELLTAGHVVVARCKVPAGRWLLDPGAEERHWQEAHNYVESLNDRAVAIFARAKHARQAIDRMEAARTTDTTGQHRLFT